MVTDAKALLGAVFGIAELAELRQRLDLHTQEVAEFVAVEIAAL